LNENIAMKPLERVLIGRDMKYGKVTMKFPCPQLIYANKNFL
jgi:hypothetical protein